MRFEIKEEEGLARIGKLKINGKTVETPVFFPVIHPSKKVPKYIKKTSKVVITNSYITLKNKELKENALKHGIHKLIDFNGIVMTDSGAYQLMVYKDIDITNQEIIEFQKKIGSDIGVILDYPSPIGTEYEKLIENTEKTFKHAEIANNLEWGNTNFIFPIHGAPYLEIMEKYIDKFTELEQFKLTALGSIVPSMITYNFDYLFRSIALIKNKIKAPLHLFGLGHTLLIAPSILFGGDSFDSASYYLFAKDDRIITKLGTRKLEELKYLPKEAHTEYTLEELKKLDKKERIEELTKINYFAILNELENVKQAIYDGKLFEYASSIVKQFAYLRDEYFNTLNTRPFKDTPLVLKKALFVQGEESFLREEYLRHFEKLERLFEYYEEVNIGESSSFVFDQFFGLIPFGWKQIWPYFQRIQPKYIDSSKTLEILSKLLKDKKIITKDEEFLREFKVETKEPKRISNEERFAQALFYFTEIFDKSLFENIKIKKGKKRDLKEIYKDDKLYAVFRAKDGYLLPQKPLFEKIKNRMKKIIIVDNQVYGKDTILKAGIKEIIGEIIKEDLVLVKSGNKVGLGIAKMNKKEMLCRSIGGVAVKMRFWD